jgi:hypothetical protein
MTGLQVAAGTADGALTASGILTRATRSSRPSGLTWRRFEPQRPGDLLHIDVKRLRRIHRGQTLHEDSASTTTTAAHRPDSRAAHQLDRNSSAFTKLQARRPADPRRSRAPLRRSRRPEQQRRHDGGVADKQKRGGVAQVVAGARVTRVASALLCSACSSSIKASVHTTAWPQGGCIRRRRRALSRMLVAEQKRVPV